MSIFFARGTAGLLQTTPTPQTSWLPSYRGWSFPFWTSFAATYNRVVFPDSILAHHIMECWGNHVAPFQLEDIQLDAILDAKKGGRFDTKLRSGNRKRRSYLTQYIVGLTSSWTPSHSLTSLLRRQHNRGGVGSPNMMRQWKWWLYEHRVCGGKFDVSFAPFLLVIGDCLPVKYATGSHLP